MVLKQATTIFDDYTSNRVAGAETLPKLKMKKGRLTDDCVPSGDDAVKDAIEHDPMRKQGGHDLAHHPAERRSCERRSNFERVGLVPSVLIRDDETLCTLQRLYPPSKQKSPRQSEIT